MPRSRISVKKGKKKMAEVAEIPADVPAPTPSGVPLPVEKVDVKNDVSLEIEGQGDGLTLKISVRAPLLAEVIRKMAPGNYPRADYHESLRPIMMPLEANKERVVTRPAIAKTTKNFAGSTVLDMNEPPPAIMVANPDALVSGYTITLKLDKPCPPDLVKRWAKQFIDGCGDIMTAARPFKYTWYMQQTPTYK